MVARLPGDDCGQDWIWDRPAETASPAEAWALACQAWERQLAHLLERSEFYARKFRAAGVGGRVGFEDLGRLPFTTKEELGRALGERPPFGTNVCVPPERIKRVYQTSGTSGIPSVIALTAADAEVWTEIGTRSYWATGIHPHHGVVSTYGAGPYVAGHTYLVLLRIGARSVPVGPGDTHRVLFALRNGLADTLLATPSYAQHLADHEDAAGLTLGHLVTAGEPGGGIPAVRDHLQRRLQTTVTEVMGIGDVSPSLFGECPQQQGMHFCGTGHVWPELVDLDTREPMAIETGAVGELAYTHLTREAMPLVRFLGGDVVRIEGTSCRCGRTGFRMRCLGRRDDLLMVRGVNLYPSAVLDVVGEFRPRVTGRARLVREGGGVTMEPPVPVEVEVPDGPVDPGLAAWLEERLRERLRVRFRVRTVPSSAFGDSAYKTPLSVRPQ